MDIRDVDTHKHARAPFLAVRRVHVRHPVYGAGAAEDEALERLRGAFGAAPLWQSQLQGRSGG